MKSPQKNTFARARESAARDTILNAAKDAAHPRGFAVTLAEITAAAGVSNSTLYRYFPAGRDGVVKVLAKACVDDTERLSVPIRRIEDPEEALSDWLHVGFVMVDEYGMLAVEIASGVIPDFCIHTIRLNELYRFTGYIIKRWATAGHARDDLVTQEAVQTWFALVAPIRLRDAIGDPKQIAEIARTTLVLFQRAYGRRT